MPVPDYQSLMLPLLRSLGDGNEHHLKDVREQIVQELRLSEEDCAELLPSGKQPVFENRLGWSKTYMDKAGLLTAVRRGVYRITDRRRNVLALGPKSVTNELLSQFSEFQQFRGRVEPASSLAQDSQPSLAKVPAQERATPEESLESAYKELRKKTEDELLAAVVQASPRFFERLVVELLVKMGYGGSLEDAGKALGRSHDGGVDGMIKEDPLGLDVIYVQAKRWQDTVGRPEVQGFAGTLEGERGRKGVFLTTSAFSREAREYVAKIDKKIVLIDGIHLASLMFDFNIGITTAGSYELKRVDFDFFLEG